MNQQAQITNLFEQFKTVYARFNGLPVLGIADKINRGDCGVTAIAVGPLLAAQGLDVHYLHNTGHVWLQIDGVRYDTIHPEGYGVNQAILLGRDPVAEVSLDQLCEDCMPCDTHGAYLVKAFCDTQGKPYPAQIQHCFDNELEYESEEGVAYLKQNYARATTEVPA